MSKLEKAEEAEVGKWCKAHGVLFIKFTPLGEKGWPDRIAIFPNGHHVWTELKRRGETPTKLQHHRILQLGEQGVEATWFDSAKTCIEFYKGILDE